eukprot:scaffold18805_cov95-Cyclotella_meneghiniana.AAC.7
MGTPSLIIHQRTKTIHKTKHGKAQTDTHRWKEERGRHDMLRIMIYDFNKWLLTLISYFHYVLANTYTFNIWHLKQKSASGGKKKHKVNAGAGKAPTHTVPSKPSKFDSIGAMLLADEVAHKKKVREQHHQLHHTNQQGLAH